MVYTIKGLDIRDVVVGTTSKPFLYTVTSGKYNHKSLVLHCKMQDKYYEYTIKRVNSANCDFKCNVGKCIARARFELRGDFIQSTGKDNRNKTIFNIDRSHQALRDPLVWTVLVRIHQHTHVNPRHF